MRHPNYQVARRSANTLLMNEVLFLQGSSDSEYVPSSTNSGDSRDLSPNPWHDMPALDTSDHSSLPYSEIYHGNSIIASTTSSQSTRSSNSSDDSITESTCQHIRTKLRERLSSPITDLATTVAEESSNYPMSPMETSTNNNQGPDDHDGYQSSNSEPMDASTGGNEPSSMPTSDSEEDDESHTNESETPTRMDISPPNPNPEPREYIPTNGLTREQYSDDCDPPNAHPYRKTTHGYIDSDGVENVGSSNSSASSSDNDERSIVNLIAEAVVTTNQIGPASINTGQESTSSIESWEKENSIEKIEEKVSAKESKLRQVKPQTPDSLPSITSSSGGPATEGYIATSGECPRGAPDLGNQTPKSNTAIPADTNQAPLVTPAQMNESREPVERRKSPLASTPKQNYTPRITRSMKRKSRHKR